MELLLTVSPRTANNLYALQLAIRLRESGLEQRKVTSTLMKRLGMKRTKAWQISAMAADVS